MTKLVYLCGACERWVEDPHRCTDSDDGRAPVATICHPQATYPVPVTFTATRRGLAA